MFEQCKTLNIATCTATNAGTATATLDTIGFDFLTLNVTSTTSVNTTNNPSVFKLAECDTSNGTFADVSGTVGDTDWTIPAEVTATTTPTIVKFNIDLRHRKRFLKLSVSPLTTQTFKLTGELMRGETSPNSAANANVAALVGV